MLESQYYSLDNFVQSSKIYNISDGGNKAQHLLIIMHIQC